MCLANTYLGPWKCMLFGVKSYLVQMASLVYTEFISK